MKEKKQKNLLKSVEERERLLGLNRYFANKKTFIITMIIFFLIGLFLLNAVITSFIKPGFFVSNFSFMDGFFFHEEGKTFYLIFVLLFLAKVLHIWWKVRQAFATVNVGQQGTSRKAEREEILTNDKTIPDREKRFKGGGGIPVAREGNKLLIDDSPVNNLTIGISRSGKGEMVVFPLIDIYSRAQKQASMIIADPKLELAQASIPRLEKLGYECHLLNLIDPEFSMGFNPLSLILEEYKSGDFAAAEQLARALCYSIYSASEINGDTFWSDNSTSLLTALILASIEDNLKEDHEENEKRYFKYEEEKALKVKIAKERLYEEDYDKWDCYRVQENYFNIIEHGKFNDDYDPKEEAFEDTVLRFTSSKEDELKRQVKTKEYISRSRVYLEYEMEEYVPYCENEKKINIYSIFVTFTTLANTKVSNEMTALDMYFLEREETNKARIMYGSIGISGEKTKGSIYSSMLTGLNVFTQTNIAKMTAKSTFDVQKIGFGGKPIALFIGIPDYDSSNYFIASIFIKQVYYTLAKLATANPIGKCYREVIFILDEFGNLPAIEDMDGIITVCLGRNIKFNLFIQSYSQISKIYGEDSANTISGNCGNHLYILTNDLKTAKEFSERLGTETITDITRHGYAHSLDKTITESQIRRPLIDPDELMRLLPGEMIVSRVMRRNDVYGNAVRALPIFNLGEHRMLYRYEYLLDFFPPGQQLYESPMINRVNRLIKEANEEEEAEERARLKAAEKYEFIDLTPKASLGDRIKAYNKKKPFSNLKVKTPTPDEKKYVAENTKGIILSEYTWSAVKYLKEKEILKKQAYEVLTKEELFKIADLLRLKFEERSCLMCLQEKEENKITLNDLIYSAKRALKLSYMKGYEITDIIKEAIEREELPVEIKEEESEEDKIIEIVYKEIEEKEKNKESKNILEKIDPSVINKNESATTKMRKRPPDKF